MNILDVNCVRLTEMRTVEPLVLESNLVASRLNYYYKAEKV